MEKLEHALWIVQAANAIFGPAVNWLLGMLGMPSQHPHEPIPDYIVMTYLIVIALSALAFAVKSRLSVEHPGTLQIIFEDVVGGLCGMLDDIVGPKGRSYLTLVGTIGTFIFFANLIGLVPGFKSPTSSINVTLGCAITVWVYYHIQGVRAQGIVSYLKHFAVPPGAHWSLSIVWLPIEIISHISRVLSLSLRLFGNIFGEDLVILILFSIVPFVVPALMMFLGIITSVLQAFIFVMLTMIYLGGAVAAEHEHEESHEHEAAHHAESVAA